jgi:hypothetical protein
LWRHFEKSQMVTFGHIWDRHCDRFCKIKVSKKSRLKPDFWSFLNPAAMWLLLAITKRSHNQIVTIVTVTMRYLGNQAAYYWQQCMNSSRNMKNHQSNLLKVAKVFLTSPVNTPIIPLFYVFKSMFFFWLTQSNVFDSSKRHALLLFNVC